MAYNFNSYQQPYLNNSNAYACPPDYSQNNGIIWVQGENAAKSYPVRAGQSLLLMDSENPVMYIKSVDQSGMPLPLRVFDYTERTGETEKQSAKEDYISRSEFEKFKEEIKESIKQSRPNNNFKKQNNRED